MATLAEQQTAQPQKRVGALTAALTSDVALVLYLFVFFRFMSILIFLPGGYLFRGRMDHGFYYSFAELSARGDFPYVSFWMEYPPLFAWTLVGAYQLSTLLPPVADGFFWFHTLVSLFLLLTEAGNLVLVYLLAQLMYDHQAALRCAWLYALLFTPLYVLLGTMESYPLFFLLLGLYLALRRRPALGGLATGIGFQVKLLPVLVVPVAWHALSNIRQRLTYLLSAAGAVVVIALPFLLINRAMLVASFRAMLTRSSWETVWALLEGYFSFGKVAPIADRFSPETATWQSHASTLPWLWIEGAFLVLYLLIWTRRVDWRNTRAPIALAGLTVNLLFLASKGYSPQFSAYVLPFIVLLLPNTRGIVYIVLLSVFDFAEGALYLTFFLDQPWMVVVTVLGRTLVWLVLCLEYLVTLAPRLHARLDRLRQLSLLPGIGLAAAVTTASLVMLPVLLAPKTARYEEAAAFIRQQGAPDLAIVLTHDDSYGAVRRHLPGAVYWMPTARDGLELAQKEADLAAFIRGHAQVWLLVDHELGETPLGDDVRYWLDWYASPNGVRWFEGLELRGYHVPATGDPETRVGHRLKADFGPLELLGYDIVPGEAAAGETFRLILYWRSTALAPQDYDVFAHLINPVYRSFGGGDRSLVDETGRPTTQWSVGQVVRQTYDLKTIPTTPPGEYRLEVGVYDVRSGTRLHVIEGAATTSPSDRVLISGVTVRRGAAVALSDVRWQLSANLGGQATLAGYDLAGTPSPGNKLTLTLYWRAIRQMQDELTVFVHLVDGAGRVRAQQDSGPADGTYPTNKWQPAELVRDIHDLTLPPDLPAGTYRLRVGLYQRNGGQRLALQDDDRSGVDYVDLGEVNVDAP